MDGETLRETPLVSVIVPVYNAEKVLPACVDSVLSQSYPNIELLLCEDGGKDGSLALCREYERRDARVRVFAQENAGPAAARNMALPNVRGKYIQFCDSDDRMRSGATEALVRRIQDTGSDLVIARFCSVVGKRETVHGLIEDERTLDKRAFLLCLMEHPGSFYYSALWNKLYRADIIRDNALAFDAALSWGEDSAMNLRYARFAQAVATLSLPVYEYVRHINSVTWRASGNLARSAKIKLTLYELFKSLYVDEGMLEENKAQIRKFLTRITLAD